jgi:hypothetical protein
MQFRRFYKPKRQYLYHFKAKGQQITKSIHFELQQSGHIPFNYEFHPHKITMLPHLASKLPKISIFTILLKGKHILNLYQIYEHFIKRI